MGDWDMQLKAKIKNWLLNVLMVISFSQRTQWSLLFGLISLIGISILGEILLADFQLEGLFQPMGEVIKEKFLRHYDKLALIAFFSFMALAVKTYKQDKRRLDTLL